MAGPPLFVADRSPTARYRRLQTRAAGAGSCERYNKSRRRSRGCSLTRGSRARIFARPTSPMKKTSAFTLIELLVVISIIAVLAGLAVPALTNALTKGQMTGTMNNARQLYLAGFQMANDGSANSDPSLAWPGDLTTSSGS